MENCAWRWYHAMGGLALAHGEMSRGLIETKGVRSPRFHVRVGNGHPDCTIPLGSFSSLEDAKQELLQRFRLQPEEVQGP